MTEGEDEFIDPELAEELAAEEVPEPDQAEAPWDDRSPEDHVGGLFVGDRQRTLVVPEGGRNVRYRIGFSQEQGIVFDRLSEGESSEPSLVDRDDTPKSVQKAADELLVEHMPEAAEILKRQRRRD